MTRRVYVAGRIVSCVRCNVPIVPGQLQQAQGSNARCLRCAGIAHLVLVPAGDAALTRRAMSQSRRRHAIVLRYRRRYGRYERVGILVEPGALARARLECAGDADLRQAQRERAHARDECRDAAYVVAFAATIRAEFPAMPAGVERAIAEHACERGSGRIGRTARAKSFHRRAIFRAVCAHIRHRETRYEALLASGTKIWFARKAVQPEIHELLKRWRTPAAHTSASRLDPAGSDVDVERAREKDAFALMTKRRA